MKKLTLLFVAVAFSLTQMVAQESTFQKGDKVLNVAVGFGSSLYSGSGYTTSVPPLSASFEIGVKDGVLEKGSIGVGGLFAYAARKWEYAGWGWKYTNVIIGARGTFHYPLVDKLDTYTGLVLGYNIVSATEIGTIGSGYAAKASGVAYSWFVGARYYFTDSFAALGELGVGISYINIGVALKF